MNPELEAIPDDSRQFIMRVLVLAPQADLSQVMLKSIAYAETVKGLPNAEYQSIFNALSAFGREISRDRQVDRRVQASQGLLLQLHGLGVSVWGLFQGWPAQNNRRLYDAAGIASLARTAMETFVAFHHVFVDSKDDPQLFGVRYMLWELAGHLQFLEDTLGERIGHQPSIDARSVAERKLEEFRPGIEKFLLQNGLSHKQIKHILRRGDWKLGKSRNYAYQRAGLGQVLSDRSYAHFSSNLHADSHAAQQTVLLREHPDSWPVIANVAIRTLAVCMSKAVLCVAELAPGAVTRVNLSIDSAISIVYHEKLAKDIPRVG